MLAPRSARAKHSAILGKSHGIRNLPGSPSFSRNFFRRTAEQCSFSGVLANSDSLSLFVNKVLMVGLNLGIRMSASAKGIEGLWLGFGALTGEASGSMIRATTSSEFKNRDSVLTTRVPLRVVIPFNSSFGLVIVLPGRVPEPKDDAVEESEVDEPELGNPELDKMVLDKLEVGFDFAQRSESSGSITSSSYSEIAALKAKMAKINKNLMRVLQVNQQVKAVTLNCETCGGPYSFSNCPATEFWYTTDVEEETKTITFLLSWWDKPMSFTQDEFIYAISLPICKDAVLLPPKETVSAGLATLGLFDKDKPTLSSTVLVNSSPLKMKHFSPI
nr:hypothetical protein [Tanacetum cinerariifolium]